jgi:hypothetical protein
MMRMMDLMILMKKMGIIVREKVILERPSRTLIVFVCINYLNRVHFSLK